MTDTSPDTPEWPTAVTAPADPPIPADTPATAPRSRRSGALVGAWVVLALVIASLIGLSAYLYAVHTQYVSQNDKLRSEATALGAQLAQERAATGRQAAELSTIETQLAQAKERISTLANDAAQAGDDRLALVDVAASLITCADQRQTLIGYLKQSSLYTAASLRASEAQITTYCNGAEQTYNQILSGG